MGPEIVIIAFSYNVAAVLAVLLIGGLAPRRTRKGCAIIGIITLVAAAYGYFSAPPHWERYLAIYLFAVVGVISSVIALLWAVGVAVIRRISRQGNVEHAV